MATLGALLAATCWIVFFALFRVAWALWAIPRRRRVDLTHSQRVLVVCGSGGHTAEMVGLLRMLETRGSEGVKFTYTFVKAATDSTSAARMVGCRA